MTYLMVSYISMSVGACIGFVVAAICVASKERVEAMEVGEPLRRRIVIPEERPVEAPVLPVKTPEPAKTPEKVP